MRWRNHALCALGLGIVLLTLGGLAQRLPSDLGGMDRRRAVLYIAYAAAAGVLYAVAVWLVQRTPDSGRMGGGRMVGIVLALAGVMRVLTLGSPPLLSTDLYRYVWDGKVQTAGLNPYLYLPAAPELQGLRDNGTGVEAIYPNINRADYAPTIYPPVAQAIFAVVARAWPTIWGMKAAMLVFDALAIAAALLLLRTAGLPAERVLILAWNPLTVWEFAGGGHIDAAALAFSGMALLLAAWRFPSVAGLALGAAVLCKLLPAALFPAVWRRWDLRTPLACGALIVVGYLCYAGAGWRVLGYLPGYASEEGLGDGGGLFLLRLWALLGPLPSWAGAAYAAAAALGLLGLAGWIALRTPLPVLLGPRAIVICRDAVWLTTATMFAISPHYPWYFTALVLPMVLAPAPFAIWLTLAAPVLYLDHGLGQVAAPAALFIPFVGLLALDLVRHRAGSVLQPAATGGL